MSRWLAVLVVVAVVCQAPAQEPSGWRTDGTGIYPGAQPPLEWSTESNVVWKTPMPGASNSIPVLVGQRLFICAEPNILLCVDRDTGKILWQKNNRHDELDIPIEIERQLKLEQAEANRIAKQQSALNRESDTLRRKLKEEADAKPALDKKLDELRADIETLKKQKEKLALAQRYTPRGKEGTAGYTTPTPATNGKEVFVAIGDGLVACFDLEGNRKWLKLIEQSTASFAHSSSPILVGDTVLVHYADLVALDAKDGSERWRVKKPPAHGTSVATRIGATDVLITPQGLIVRVQDGVILAEGLGQCGANSPILRDGVVYFVRGSVAAVQLPSALNAPAKLPALWKSKMKGGGYWFPSPLVHEGLLYGLDDRGIFSVLEADTGKLVYEERLELGGTNYPSLSLAGKHIYASSDNGTTVVVQAGRDFKELARNKLEPFRSSLVFEGKRMYVRTQKHLYCIGE